MSRLLLQYCAVVAVVWLFSVAPAAAQASADSDHDAAVLRIIEQFEQQPSSQLAVALLGLKRYAAAEAAYKLAVKTVDQAVVKGLLHKNNAARKKSSMTLKLNQLA